MSEPSSPSSSSPVPDLVLALDSGSQSSRALLFDGKGAVLASASRAHQPMRHPVADAVEQDPHDIRSCLFGSVADCLAAWDGDPSRIAAAALTTQRSTFLGLDGDGKPLADAVSWLDRRRADLKQDGSRLVRVLSRVLGDDAVLSEFLSRALPRVWRQQQPELLEAVRRFAPLEAWLNQELTGRLAMAPGGMAGVLPADMKKRGWTEVGALYRLLGFEREWLPDIVEAGRAIGGLSAAAAAETGLPEGLPVIACGGDKQAEGLGVGLRPGLRGVAGVSLGTASSIYVPSGKAKESRQYHWILLCAAEPAAWMLEYMVFRGMWTARWFADQLGGDLRDRAAAEGRPVEALLVDEAAQAPPGSDGVVIWPRWSPSLQHPTETGAVVGLRETHSRGHMFRALLEGIAFDLRRGREILEGATGEPITSVRVGGGGSRSDLVVSILADVLNLPVVRPSSEELSARGAAIVAAVGGGVHRDFDAAVSAMVPDAPTVQPNPANAALYGQLYERAFHPGLEPLRDMGRLLQAARGRRR